jgi:predicted permease
VFAAVRAHDQVIADVVGFMRLEDRPAIAVDGETQPEREVELVSANFFTSLGVALVAGRAPGPSDDRVAVISARWWRQRFGGRPDVLGRMLSVAGGSYAIVGVAPPRFHGFLIDRSADIWIHAPDDRLELVARLQPGVGPLQAQTAIHSILADDVRTRYPDQAAVPMVTEATAIGQGISNLRVQYRGALLALMALVAVVLLTTTTNVGNLLMVRQAARRRELAVRAALGASRSRLVAQSLVESTVLAAAGCLAGLLLARWGVSAVLSMLPLPAPPGGMAFVADARVIGFAAAVAAASVLLFGLGPAWRVADVDLSGDFRSSQGLTAPRRTRRLARALVVCQVCLSLILLVAAGLFVQTLRNLSALDLGFHADPLLQVAIDPRAAGYPEEQLGSLQRVLIERVGALPGVRSTTSVDSRLMQGSSTSMAIPIPGLERRGDEVWDGISVGPQFFETMGIELVRGRGFTAADFSGEFTPPLTGPSSGSRFVRRAAPFVINEAFARHYFPNADPLSTTSPIVGIVKDAKLLGVGPDIQPLMFMPSRRPRLGAIVARTTGQSPAATTAIREAIQGVHPRLVVEIATIGEAMNRNIARERMVAAISGFFGVLGLVLASVGIFGVASSSVAQRTREFAIRRALGAGGCSVIWTSVRETLVVFGIGLAGGTVAAFVAVRLAASVIGDLLFGLSATDPTNLIAAVGVMLSAALMACTVPALRATRIDPLAVLRDE